MEKKIKYTIEQSVSELSNQNRKRIEDVAARQSEMLQDLESIGN